mgnify:CR=1 FL=1
MLKKSQHDTRQHFRPYRKIKNNEHFLLLLDMESIFQILSHQSCPELEHLDLCYFFSI